MKAIHNLQGCIRERYLRKKPGKLLNMPNWYSISAESVSTMELPGASQGDLILHGLSQLG